MVRDPDGDVAALEPGSGAGELESALLGNLELDEAAP
jgi:hypothetical protein